MVHEFGGEWTDLKLEVMRAYFSSYAIALKNRNFQCWYIDAFAGTGERIASGQRDYDPAASLFGEDKEEVAKAKDGSVRIALSIEPSFKQYIFIDRSREHTARLEALRSDYPNRSIRVISGDANNELVRLCSETNWRRTRAAVFLDPYGMQIQWSTLEQLAGSQAVDVALLFPTGTLNRMLPRHQRIPEEWERRIDEHLGTTDWRTALYQKTSQATLFDSEDTVKKVQISALRTFVRERLRSIFSYVHEDAVPLMNSKDSVLYDLFIICANPSDKAKDLSRKLAAGAIKAASTRRN